MAPPSISGRKPLLLLIGAELGDPAAGQHVHAGAQRDRRPAAGQFLEHLQVDDGRLTAAAELLRVGQRQQTELTELGEQLPREGVAASALSARGASSLVDQVAGQLEQIGGLGAR